VLAPYHDRITWDAPIHSVADVQALAFAPKMLNVKPSRFGTLHALFDYYDHCGAEGIANYGGGQTELASAAARSSTWRRCFTRHPQ